MLTLFAVTNFQCIKEKATLDMRSIKRLLEHKETILANDILPISAIYGPNGGGKSTLLKALFVLKNMIARYFVNTGNIPINNEISITPFKFDENSVNRPTEFEIYVQIEEIEYKYYLSVLKNKIVEEELFYKKINSSVIKELFSRDKNGIILEDKLKKEVKLSEKISEEMPLLAWIALVYKIEIIDKLKQWFLSIMYIDYNIPFQEELLLGNILQQEIANDERSRKRKQKALKLMHYMDLNIDSYRAEKIPLNFAQFKIKITTQHIVGDNNYELDLQEESNGTRKVFSLIPMFVRALEDGRLVVIDELDAKLHPQLLKFIIQLFTNKEINTKGAQLIFTSHDLTTMTKEVFRRDEIWFMAMGEKECSELYSLTDIRTEDGDIVRNDAVFNKQYIQGRYGADPYLRVINNWED